jgi:protocatechuate 3,4-dioxygenase beta subunit
LTLSDSQGDEIATADVIEPLNYKIELTLHVRKAEPAGQYNLTVRLYYPEQADNDRKEVSFEIRAEKDAR